jgi:transposase
VMHTDKVAQLRAQGFSIRQIAAKLEIGVGTAARTLQAVPKVQCGEVEQ